MGVSAGCRTDLDGVYALPLDHAPTEADWDLSVALRLEASGGRTSRPGEGDVDSDAVHASTASCHHGTEVPPVLIDVRAFYTPDRLYLRVEWVDPTEDLGPSWRWGERGWEAGAYREDGLGILWGQVGREFSCFASCHLEDWRMAGKRAFADYRMAAPDGTEMDFWVWRAGRGRPGGMAEDASLDSRGRSGDAPGELYVSNSLRSYLGQPDAFGAGDAPWKAVDPEPGARAPAFLPNEPTPGWIEVEAMGARGRGAWRVTLSRDLTPVDAGDLIFQEGGEYRFGLAVLDGVQRDHLAVPMPVRLVLVKRSSLAGETEGDR